MFLSFCKHLDQLDILFHNRLIRNEVFVIALTIKQIAHMAGVSKATVSRAINQPHVVQKETRENIMAIIAKHHYVPSPLAKALSTGQSNLVGMFLPTLTNSVFAQMAEGCQQIFTEHGFNLMVFSDQAKGNPELSILDNIDQRQIRGLIIFGSDFKATKLLDVIEKLSVPTVMLEKMVTDLGCSSVYIDDEQGMRDALDYYLERGHQHIAVISGELELLTSKRRISAIQDTLQNPLWQHISLAIEEAQFSEMESGRLALHRLMRSSLPPTAILCLNDLLALGALKGTHELGLSLPQDLELIGFDDIPMSRYTTPTLSTLKSPNIEVGRKAATLLWQHIDDSQKKPEHLLLPVTLVHRGTTWGNHTLILP